MVALNQLNFVEKNGILQIERGALVDGNLENTAKAAFLWSGAAIFFDLFQFQFVCQWQIGLLDLSLVEHP